MTKKAKLTPHDGPIPLTLARAGELCGVTEKTLRSWIANGMPVMHLGRQGSRKDRTIVDLVEVLRWYLEQDALDAAKTRLASAQADKHEMENALRRGELADINDVARAWADLVMSCRAKLLALAMKLGPQLTNVADTAVIASRIRSEVHIALDELAAGEDGGRRPGRAEARRDVAVSTAAGSDGEPVGGRKAKAQQRIVG